MKVPVVPFADALEDVSAGNIKIPHREFLPQGVLPVVDQGSSPIAGYTDCPQAAVHHAPPLIVFGDHTRSVKYVDHPFAMGADGVKVLQAKEGFEPRYLYHYLASRNIPSAGYSRHYKFLKELHVPRPTLGEQRRIAAILDQADAIRAKRRQVLVHLEALVDALFRSEFPPEQTSMVGAGAVMPSMRNGVSPSSTGAHPASSLTLRSITGGSFDPTQVKAALFDEEPPAEKRIREGDFLICRGSGSKELVGVGCSMREDRPELVFPDTIIASAVDGSLMLSEFLEVAWRQPVVRRQIRRVARTTSGIYKVSQAMITSIDIPAPPVSVQEQFVERARAVWIARERVADALVADGQLFAALQAGSFRGEL